MSLLRCVRMGGRLSAVVGAICVAAVTLAATVSPAEAARKKKRVAGYNPPYAAMVVDAKTGRTLHAVNEDALRHPASITKVMTLYMLFEQMERGRFRMNSELRVSSYAASRPPSKIGVRAGETIEVEDAIKALITKSANDVAVVVAENIAGDEETFAEQMTRRARQLGMSRTTFRNASGLPDAEQVTTARDLTILARAIQERFPRHYALFQTRSFEYAGRAHRNHNKLLGRVEGVDGIKTGYTRASGFNLMTSAKADGATSSPSCWRPFGPRARQHHGRPRGRPPAARRHRPAARDGGAGARRRAPRAPPGNARRGPRRGPSGEPPGVPRPAARRPAGRSRPASAAASAGGRRAAPDDRLGLRRRVRAADPDLDLGAGRPLGDQRAHARRHAGPPGSGHRAGRRPARRAGPQQAMPLAPPRPVANVPAAAPAQQPVRAAAPAPAQAPARAAEGLRPPANVQYTSSVAKAPERAEPKAETVAPRVANSGWIIQIAATDDEPRPRACSATPAAAPPRSPTPAPSPRRWSAAARPSGAPASPASTIRPRPTRPAAT